MSDSKSERFSLELITNCMNEVAREFEVMDHDDRRQAAIIEELCLLTQLRRAVLFASQSIGRAMYGRGCTRDVNP
jgi:hypothetical protein